MFKIVGVSTHAGQTKVRFANDFVTRFKTLIKSGHTNVNLLEMDTSCSKADAVTYLKTTDLINNPLYAQAIAEADEKYNGSDVSVTRVNKPELSLDAIRSRITPELTK
jgi:hypothetical protein